MPLKFSLIKIVTNLDDPHKISKILLSNKKGIKVCPGGFPLTRNFKVVLDKYPLSNQWAVINGVRLRPLIRLL